MVFQVYNSVGPGDSRTKGIGGIEVGQLVLHRFLLLTRPGALGAMWAHQDPLPGQGIKAPVRVFYGKINVFEYVIDFKIWEKNIDFFLEIIRK